MTMLKLADGSEVDEEVAALAQKMSVGKARKEFLKLAKQVEPEMAIPEVDMIADIEAREKPLLERIGKLEEKSAKDDAMLNIHERRKPLVAAGLSAVEIDQVEKVMVEKGILNHATALDFIRNNEKLATPTTGASGSRQPMTLPSVVTKEFFADPAKEARNVAAQVLAEHRSGKSA